MWKPTQKEIELRWLAAITYVLSPRSVEVSLRLARKAVKDARDMSSGKMV